MIDANHNFDPAIDASMDITNDNHMLHLENPSGEDEYIEGSFVREQSMVQANGMIYDDVSAPNMPEVSEYGANTTFNVVSEQPP